MLCISVVLGIHLPGVKAETIPSSYQLIAYENSVPPEVLYGIAMSESGNRLRSGHFRPWPWTLNVAGVPRRYPSRMEAWKGLIFFLKQGIHSIDVGLMQVNWRYHHDKLGTPWRALDPVYNTQTGAKILRAEYQKTREWKQAIGRYHSPGKKPVQRLRAQRYADRVMRHIQRF